VIHYAPDMSDSALMDRINRLVAPDVSVEPATPALRVRHVRKEGFDWFLLFNEERRPVQVQVDLSTRGERLLVDPATGASPCVPSRSVARVYRL